MGIDFEKFVRDRDNAFIEFVMNDNKEPFLKYCKEYGIFLPKSEVVMAAAIYKATRECTYIPQEVKDVAKEKCVALGFSPNFR